VERLTKTVYVLAFGVLTFAMRNLGEPTRTALALAVGAIAYAIVVALAARVVNAVERAPRLWRAALMLIAGTGLATFLFPLPRLALVFGLVFCALDVVKHWQPDGLPVPAGKA
jgi:chromate transport protein ChrA